jgi:NTE family protein
MTAAAALAPRGRGDLAPVAELITELDGADRWPTRPATWIVAMDFGSGRRVVFGRADAPVVALADAVRASCAAPGFFPPVPIGGRRYVDGGAVSVTNADVLLREELDEVLILAPMAMYDRDHPTSVVGRLERRLRWHFTRRLDAEVGRLAATGTAVRVLGPGAEDLSVMGANVMDPRRRREVFDTALRTTRERLLDHRAAGARATAGPDAPPVEVAPQRATG